MRAIDPELQTRLDAAAATLADCWRLDRLDGRAFGFTDHDRALSFDGLDFEPTGGPQGATTETVLGLAAPTVEIVGVLESDRIADDDIERGLFDGSRLRRWLVDWTDPALRALIFEGEIGEITRSGQAFRAEALGVSARLTRPVGRRYLSTCDAALGDARCGVDLAAQRVDGTVESLDAAGRLTTTGLDALPPGWLARGALVWEIGANAGLRTPILADATVDGARVLTPWTPPPAAVAPGDRFAATAGCDKSFSTCRDKFANILNFRGFPHMPGDDWATGYPRAGERNDGGSRHG